MKEKIKRISSSTWALLLALMMVVSSFSVLAATTNVNKTGVSENINSDDTIYLKPNEEWLKDNSKFGIYVWNNTNDSHWALMNDDDGDGYYSATVPSGGPYANIIFLRFNSFATAISGTEWPSNVSNQTGNLTKDAGANCYSFTENKADRPAGAWSKYSETKEVASNVALSSDGGSGLKVGDTVTLTVTATTDITTSDIIYTFTDSFDNSTKTITSGKTAQATFENLKAGTHKFTVTASKSGYTDKRSNEISVPVTGGSSSTNTIYFKDTVGWGSVFAYFYNDSYKPDAKNGCSGVGADKKVPLTLVSGETDIYSYTFDSSVSYSKYSKVCFTKYQQDTYDNFHYNEAAYREDLRFSSGKTMYVPETTPSGTLNSNVPYYNNGAWEAYAPAPTMYNVETGVKLSTDGATYTESSDYTVPTGGGSVTSTKLTAIDITGYTFVGWETSNRDPITSTDKSVDYTPTSDVTVYAKYNKNYTITINNTVENGTVKVDNATTGKTVTAGTEVEFTATANEGYQFTSWTGALTGETSATVKKTVTKDMNVGATFSKASYTITKASTSNGSFTVTSDSGAEITSANYGDTVTVTPTPADGYKLDSVKYNDTTISANDGKYSFTMPAGNVTVSVTFKAIPKFYIYGSIVDTAWNTNSGKEMTYDSATGYYSIVVPSNRTDKYFRLHSNGSVYGPNSASKAISTDEHITLESGNNDYAYYIDGMTTGHVYTIYTDGQSVWYTDTQNKHNITVDTTTKNGSVTATPSTEAGAGATVTLTNTPNAGYTLDSYKVYKTGDESTTVNVTDGTFTMPDYDVTVTAKFKKIDYTMTVSANPSALNKNVSVSKQTANIGDKVTFTANDVEGYNFTGWTLTGATVVNTSLKEITVTVGTENVTAIANYTVKRFNIEQSPTLINGSISVNANANYGEDVTFTITPASGYQVVNDSVTVITSDGETVTVTAVENGTYTFKMPASNVTISANFELAKYTITKPTTTDFTVTVDGDLAEATVGTKVSFTVAKAHEYAVLDKVTVTDASDKKVSLTKGGDKYTFTMPASNVTINVTSSTSSTGYGLVGSLNNWNTGANVFVKDSSSTSNYSYTTVDLTAGTYEFKVAHGVDWYTKANTTITSSSCTDIQFSINSSESANCSITVTESGTYKFVWNESTKKISVIYPNAKYYVVGRFPYDSTLIDWEPTSTKLPFTYDNETGYYKYDTGKTIKELSGTGGNNDAAYYFWVYNGGTSHYVASPANTTFQNNTESKKFTLTYKTTSNPDKEWLRFYDTSSTNTSPVTLWYDPVERQIWYEALSPVASVTLSAEDKTYYYGDSVTLTANVNSLVSGARNEKYTFTEVDENGSEVSTPVTSDTNTVTFDNLTDGTHYYKVEVSAEGYKSVTATTSITVTPLDVDNYEATVNPSDNATITVTCKDTTITGGNTGELPENGNAIISVTGIKDGYKVKNVTVITSDGQTVTVTAGENGTYTFTMPASNVTITVDVVAKSQYAVNFGVSDKTGGSITATAGSTLIKSGAIIAEGTQVTFNAEVNDGYVISGWYSDSSCTKKIDDVKDNATSYTTTISGITNVYVKISEDAGTPTNYRLYYGSNNESNPSNWKTYVPVYKKANGELVASIPDSLFVKNNKHFFALFKDDKTVDNMQWNNRSYKVERKSSNTEYVTVDLQDNYDRYNNFASFYFHKVDGLLGLNIVMNDPEKYPTVGSYVVTPIVKTAPEGALEVYAKDGTLKTTSGYGDTTVSGMNVDCEGFEVDNGTYKQYAAMPGDRLTITTVVNNTEAAQGWYVSNYVINGVGYDAISTVKAQALAQAGSTGASYTIATPYPVTGKETKNIIEITPIYKNRKIEADNDYITLYANADSLGDAWGNTISVYSYYYKEGKKNENTDKAMNSAYPGEPMMKTSSGLYVAYVPKNAWGVENGEFKKLSDYEVSGITFNNYKEDETIHQKVLEGEHQLQNNQTYDYDDFKYIAAAGYDTVLYDFKYRNGTTNQSTLVKNGNTYDNLKPPATINPSVYADTNHNGWEVLTNMDNEEVSLLGYSARNASTIGGTFDNKNRLHIVSVGNINTTMGKWSTVWFVYDKDNKLVTYGIPSDFIPRLNSDGSESTNQTDAYKAIIKAKLEYTGAYITYESEMDPSSSTDTKNSGNRSDGRWYYSRAVDQVKVNTHVLYANAKDSASWTEDKYGSDYAGTFTGAKALVGSERTTSVDRNSEVSITASALSKGTANKQYKFIGWTTNATKGDDGSYTIVQNPDMTQSTKTIKVSTNMDLYALYIPVANGDLIITHEKYTGEGAFGGPGRYFVQAKLYNSDNVTVKKTYYQEGSVTIPNYTETSGKIDVQLIVYSVNGSRYKATYNYQNTAITNESHVDKVCSSGDPAVVAKSFTAKQIFENGVMKTNKVAYYSDLQTNNITVTMNYYNRKVENGKPADMDSNPKSYSYIFTSYPKEVLNNDGTLSIPTLIEYAKNHSQQPDNMIEKYISWNSQDDALKGIVKYTNYHTKTNDKYEATPYHTDQYGKVQKTGEKWVTYYDRNGVEVDEEDAKAETVSSISIWYFNTPKKYTYTLNTANSSSELGDNKDGTFYGTTTETASGLFYNTRLFSSDREVSNASSPYTKAYGVEQGYTGQAINTAETINNGGTTLKFLYWAYDTAGKKIASTNIQYGLRITNNTTLYAIYGENKITAPGLTVQEVTPDTFFDSNNISKTRINTIFNPYNCKDNDKNIDSASVVYLRVASSATKKSLNNLNDADLQELRKQISTVVSKASYEKFKSGDVDNKASQQIVKISGSTASGFKFKIVDTPSSSSTELQTSLSNKNRGQFTTTFTTSILKNYTYYVFATMGYKNYNGNDKSVVEGSDGISYITSDNFAKYDFDKDGKYYVPSSNS